MSNEDDKTVKTTPVPTVDEINTFLSQPIKDPLIGTKLAGGRYEILDALGEGGMSVVYKAKQELVDRIVAIKTLKMTLLADPMILKRFEREVKTLSRLNHPNIVTVFDCIVENGQPYFVMDFLQGCSLQDLIHEEKRLSPGRCKNIFGQVCNAVEHAHRNGIVHRDLKPANIMLMDISGQEFVKVVDFGLAKIGEEAQRLTQSGEIWGSPLYMSPEQCSGHSMDARSDIYSLGSVLYEALTGRVPFAGTSFLDTIQKVVSLAPPTFATSAPDLKCAPEIEEIVMRCLEKSPDKRYQTMAELKDAIDRVFPVDDEALFRTLPPGKMVVDKAAVNPTRELKRDPESVIATKRMRRSEINVTPPAAVPPQSSKVPAKAISSKAQKQGKKDAKSATLMAGVIGGLIAACAVVAVNLINNQQPAAPPVVPAAPSSVPSKPPVQATTATAAPTAAPTKPTSSAPTNLTPTSQTPTSSNPTSPAVPHDTKENTKSGGETQTITTKATPPVNKEEALKALQGSLDHKPALTPPTPPTTPPTKVDIKSAPNSKTAHKPVHKAAHLKPHQGSSAGSASRPSHPGPDDSELWNEHIQKY